MLAGVYLVMLWIVFGVCAGLIAESKGRSVAGWTVLGFVLGPPAIFLIGFMERVTLREAAGLKQ